MTASIPLTELLVLYRIDKACTKGFELATRVFSLPYRKPVTSYVVASRVTDPDAWQYDDDIDAAPGTEPQRCFVQKRGVAISDESSPSSEYGETDGSEHENVDPFIDDESAQATKVWRSGSSQQPQALPQQWQVCTCPRIGITNPGSLCYLIALAQMLYNVEGSPDMAWGRTPIPQRIWI
jgi:hypothetical protein